MSRDQFGTSDNGRPTLVLGNKHTITIEKVDIDRLRRQRDTLVKVVNGEMLTPKVMEHIDGVIFMCDEMLDIAEGFKV